MDTYWLYCCMCRFRSRQILNYQLRIKKICICKQAFHWREISSFKSWPSIVASKGHNYRICTPRPYGYLMNQDFLYVINSLYIQDRYRGDYHGAESLIFETGVHIIVVYTPGKVGLFPESDTKSVTLAMDTKCLHALDEIISLLIQLLYEIIGKYLMDVSKIVVALADCDGCRHRLKLQFRHYHFIKDLTVEFLHFTMLLAKKYLFSCTIQKSYLPYWWSPTTVKQQWTGVHKLWG